MSLLPENTWKRCPTGEFARLSARLRGRRRRRGLARMGVALAAVVMIAVGGWAMIPACVRTMDLDYAGIPCSRVMSLAADYSRGRLAPVLHDQVKAHLDQCTRCHFLFKVMRLAATHARPAGPRFSRPSGV